MKEWYLVLKDDIFHTGTLMQLYVQMGEVT